MIGTKEAFRNQGIHVGPTSYEDSKNRESCFKQNLVPASQEPKTNLKKETRNSSER